MKITPPETQAPRAGARMGRSAKVAYGEAGPSRATSKSPASGDQVRLSSTASELSEALRAQGRLPGAEPARLAALREAIQRGDYPVDAEALAGAILDDDVAAMA